MKKLLDGLMVLVAFVVCSGLIGGGLLFLSSLRMSSDEGYATYCNDLSPRTCDYWASQSDLGFTGASIIGAGVTTLFFVLLVAGGKKNKNEASPE
jgi:hypothetical protein